MTETTKHDRFIVGAKYGKDEIEKKNADTFTGAEKIFDSLWRKKVKPETAYIYDTVAKQMLVLRRGDIV